MIDAEQVAELVCPKPAHDVTITLCAGGVDPAGVGYGEFTLEWDAPADAANVVGYRVLETLNPLDDTGSTSYTVTGQAIETVWYQVIALGDGTESARSFPLEVSRGDG